MAAQPLREVSVLSTEVQKGIAGPVDPEARPATPATQILAPPQESGLQTEGGRPLEVRAYRESDEIALTNLWILCELTRPWNNPAEDIQRKLAVQRELFLVVYDQERLVGSIMGGYDGHRGWVNYLAVDPACRRSGIARHLMSRIERELKARGCPKVNLQMRAENTLAGVFYESLGYKEDVVRCFGLRLIEDA